MLFVLYAQDVVFRHTPFFCSDEMMVCRSGESVRELVFFLLDMCASEEVLLEETCLRIRKSRQSGQ